MQYTIKSEQMHIALRIFLIFAALIYSFEVWVINENKEKTM